MELDHHTFLPCDELLISRKALAPRSRASGSKPAAVVRGLSLRTRASSLGGATARAGGAAGEPDTGAGGAAEEGKENGVNLKGPPSA